MTDWKAVRDEFPAVSKLVYLNTAGGGLMAPEAVAAAEAYYRDFHESGDTKWEFWLSEVDSVRARLARLVECAPEEIAFCGNASQGLNLVAELFEDAGDVVTLADEFPSVTYPWLTRGRNVRFLDSGIDGSVSLDAVADALRPGVGVVSVSWVQYRSGFRFDLESLSALCRERDVRLVVDATQGFGVLPLSLLRAPVDALVFSGYKWATAGYGVAPLIVRRELLQGRELPAAGWRSSENAYALTATELAPLHEAKALEMGHPPFAAVQALGGALTRIESLGLEAITDRVQALVDQIHEATAATNAKILSPKARASRSAIVLLATSNADAIVKKLRKRGVVVSARGEGVRLSLHYYNNEQDIERTMDELSAES